MEERAYSQEDIDRVQKVVSAVTDFVNGNMSNADLFIRLMANEHRTLQQLFTKLLFKWLEYAASPEYRHDGRNEATHKVAAELLEAWAHRKPDSTDTYPPSGWLPLI